MKFSIIVPTYNQCESYLRPCIESILKYSNMAETEIIVVANGCQDGTKEYIKDMKHLWFDGPIGYTKACNEGMKIASGEYIILLNDDTAILGSNWLDLLEKPFLDDDKTGITGPLKFIWDCGGVAKTAIAFWCAMFKRSLIDEIGYLDEIFNPGMGEDGDYSIKAEMAGYELVQVPVNKALGFGEGVSDSSFPIYHKGNGTFGYDTDIKNNAINRNKQILADRYGLKKEPKQNKLNEIYNICLKHECDINKLFSVIKQYSDECEHITEMGVRGVFSTYAFLNARPKKMVSYDIYTSPNINEALDLAKKEGIDFTFIETDVLKTEIEETDLLFIDTLHTYAQLSEELRLHGNKARKYILMHNTTFNGEVDGSDEVLPEGSKQGLKLAIKEFQEQNPHWITKEIIFESNGLTVLERVPKFSIVIPTCNRLETLKSCLKGVFNFTELLDKEVIVVPNGCDDGTYEYLQTLKRKITIVNIEEASGHVVPANAGVEKARGEYIILLDDDSLLLEQPINTWVDLLYNDFGDSMGITGVFAANYPYLGTAMHNGCVMFKKSIWEEVNKFDSEFGYGYLYDTDFSLKVKEAGYDIMNVGKDNKFPIYHAESPVTSEVKQKQVSLIRKNREILYRRHGMKPKYSIIVPTYNHLEDCLKPCLNSMVKLTDLSQVEVIVVANGCKDKTAEYVDSLGHPFKLLWFDEGLGFTKAINEGVKIAQADYIVLLNNDTVILDKGAPKNAWLDMLVNPFLEDDKVGITGPLELHDDYADADVMIFFCVMIKRELFDKIGLLDESYSPGGGEDVDFSVKAQQLGYKQVVVPNENVIVDSVEDGRSPYTNVGVFPIYHAGEGTFSKEEWPEYGTKIIKDNGMKNMLRYNKHIKLNVGSGGVEVPGYISVDKYDTRANIIMDVLELELPENSVEEILASHLFEHINPYNAVDLLKKWLKILKPGGKLIMEVPDIEALCRDFVTANKQGRYGILNCIYGAVNTKEGGAPSEITSPHLWGWYPEIMGDHLMSAGFTHIVFGPEQIPHPHTNFRVEANKPIPVAVLEKQEVLV